MTRAQLSRREALLDQQDTALRLWPQGKDPAFRQRVLAVAQGLEALAREVDREGSDRLERARTWRYAGLAYFDVSVGQQDAELIERLTHAAMSFQKADDLLKGLTDAVERMKLDYAYGRALLRLSQGRDRALALEARNRLASALDLARTHSPAHVESAEHDLANADKALALVEEGDAVDQQIRGLTQTFRDAYMKDIHADKVTPTERPVWASAIDELEQTVRDHVADMPTMIDRSARLRAIGERLAGVLPRTGQAPPQSRAEAVWRRFDVLRLVIYRNHYLQAGADDVKRTSIGLYERSRQAESMVAEHADDDRWIRDYERDVLRPLAQEIRTHILRNHLTVAKPVWPSSSRFRDAGSVFLSGSSMVNDLVAAACRRAGLTLKHVPAAHQYAASRWDALHSSGIAVFDYTAYEPTDASHSVDLRRAAPTATVSYELGIALALGLPMLILADEGAELPFDIDLRPVYLRRAADDVERVSEALDDTVYGIQRTQIGVSLPATRKYLVQRFAGDQLASVRDATASLDDSLDANAVKLARIADSLLLWAAPQEELLYPPWPGDYPTADHPLLFHVTPFGAPWSQRISELVKAVCARPRAPVTYVRGDQVMHPDIVQTIWSSLCRATHIVVDLTNLNPNVALELGIAHTLGRHVLLISQEGATAVKTHFPALSKQQVHRYALDQSGGHALRTLLDQFLGSSTLSII